jgi:hypothetical protein
MGKRRTQNGASKRGPEVPQPPKPSPEDVTRLSRRFDEYYRNKIDVWRLEMCQIQAHADTLRPQIDHATFCYLIHAELRSLDGNWLLNEHRSDATALAAAVMRTGYTRGSPELDSVKLLMKTNLHVNDRLLAIGVEVGLLDPGAFEAYRVNARLALGARELRRSSPRP